MLKRKNGIDLVRIIAIFFIVILHFSFRNIDADFVYGLRLITRWAVPFFFITTGYFVGKKITDDYILDIKTIQGNVSKMISLLIIASILYAPLTIYQGEFNLQIENLFTGYFFHLWFIGSLLFGYITIWFLYHMNLVKVLNILSISVVILLILMDSYDLFFNMNLDLNFARFCLSIPLMNLGIIIYRSNKLYSSSLLIILILSGIFLQLVEGYWLKSLFQDNDINPEFTFSTLLLATPIFLLALKINLRENIMSEWGRNHSLFIYLYHLLTYQLISIFFTHIFIFEIPSLLIPLLCFLLSLISAIVLNKYLKFFYNILNGQISIKNERS